MDIGSNRRFENLNKAYINEFLSYVDIIQLNQKCIPVLYKKLDISSNLDFFDMLNLDLLVVTKGRNGANFVYSDGNTTFEVSKFPQIVADMVDSTGAGDAFLSMILKSYQKYLIQEKQIDSKFIDKSFFVANGLSRKIVKKIGARADFTIFKELIDELNAEQNKDAR